MWDLTSWEFDEQQMFCQSQGEFIAGKYKCLLCEKEFVSESGVKYHINTVHAEVRREGQCLPFTQCSLLPSFPAFFFLDNGS